MLEKFLAKALQEGVRVSKIRRVSQRESILYAPEADAQRLTELAEKFSLDLTWLRHGAAGDLKRLLWKRWSLIPGLIFMGLLVFLFAERIWVIDIKIDETPVSSFEGGADGSQLVAALDSLGVTPGTPKGLIEPDSLALQLQAVQPNYAFIGIRMTGTRLLVEAVRELPAPELYDIAGERDLVAMTDGVIARINVLAGKANVKAGDTVRMGQVLILGEEKLTDEVTHGICALGEVVANCWSVGEAEAPLYQVHRRYTGREGAGSEIRFMDFSYPLTTAEDFEHQETSVQRLPIGGLFLPLTIDTLVNREYSESAEKGDEGAIRREIAEIALKNAVDGVPDGCVMIDKWIDYSMIEGDAMRARAVVQYERNIAISRSALYMGGE